MSLDSNSDYILLFQWLGIKHQAKTESTYSYLWEKIVCIEYISDIFRYIHDTNK